MMKLAEAPVVGSTTATQLLNTIDLILAADISKSQKITKLFLLGIDDKNIAKMMNIRVNFAYNVIANYLRMHQELKIEKTKKSTIKDAIIKLINAGKSNVEISGELKVPYNRVWQVKNSLGK
jgi:hypothetical protein